MYIISNNFKLPLKTQLKKLVPATKTPWKRMSQLILGSKMICALNACVDQFYGLQIETWFDHQI